MGILDDILAADAQAFADADLMVGSESVTYTPRGGTAVTFDANVSRDVPILADSGDGYVPSIQVFVRNHATLGVTSVNTGGDTVTIAERRGGTARTHQVREVLEQDAGGWLLRLG